MLVHVAALNRTIAIDFRETAPAAASQDMFFDANGNVVLDQTYRFSHKSSVVPGSVAGLAHIVENYGTRRSQKYLSPPSDWPGTVSKSRMTLPLTVVQPAPRRSQLAQIL